MFSVEDNIFNK